MFDLLSENLHLGLINEEWKVYYMHQILDLLDFNNETHSMNAVTDGGSREINDVSTESSEGLNNSVADMTFSGSREFSLKSVDPEYIHIKVYEIIQSQDFEFKFNKSINLFWNTFFYIFGRNF